MTTEPNAASTPSPSAAPPKRKWFRWVALGCGTLVVLAAALALVMTFVVKKATAGPEAAIHGFLAAAGAGHYEEAHAYFAAPLQEVQPLEEFSQAARDNSTFFQVEDTTFNNRSIDTSSAKLSGTVTLQSGTEVPASFELVRENGAWKLIAYHIGS